MTKRLIAASLATAFSFGTAFGLVLSTASQNHAPTSAPASTDKQQAHKSPDDRLVCAEGTNGQALCWPKENAPANGSNTTCVEKDGTTLCYSHPQQNKPSLDL
jgi:hypothetical protein